MGHRRIIAEVLAIVLSILLAFAIDAGWDQHLNRLEERDARDRLAAEFSAAQVQLDEVRATHETVLVAAERLLLLVGPSSSVDEGTATLDTLLNDVTEVMTFDPRQGTLTSLIASGSLRLIEDAALRSRLAGWPDLVEDMREEQVRGWDEQGDLLRVINQYVFYRPTVGQGVWPRHPFPSDHPGLLRSRRFAELVDNRRVSAMDVLAELSEARAELEQILESL